MHVPEGWEAHKLGYLAKTVTSGSRDWAQYYSDSGSKFIRMTNLRRDGIHLKLDDLKYVNIKNDSADGKRTSLQNGDILISITAELGKVGWIPENFGEAFINQHTALVRINHKKADSKFIAYLLSSQRMNQIINSWNDAGAKAGLNLPTIKELPLLLPTFPEQQKIAQILSTWDKAIEKLEALISAKQKRKKALMQQLLTGKKRFTGFEGNWKEYSISKMGKVVSGGTPDTNTPSYWNGEILWMTPTDVTALKTRFIQGTARYITQEGVKNSSASIIPPDSLLVCTRATVGLMSISTTDITTNQGFKNLIPNRHFDVNFLYYLFSIFKKEFIRHACGSTFLELSKKDFEKLKFHCPDLKEQQKISSVLSAADQEIESHQKQLAVLKQQKKGLMQQLLTGKTRVKIDEPAKLAAVGA